MRLTGPQLRALKAMPIQITYRGGKPFCKIPNGVRTTTTLFVLLKAKMVTRKYGGLRERWEITDLGRSARDGGES